MICLNLQRGSVLIYIGIIACIVWINNVKAEVNRDVDEQRLLVDYSQPQADLSAEQLLNFAVGRSLFKKLWVAAPASTQSSDGLGPLYNARSCFMCHRNAGRGQVPSDNQAAVSLFMRLSIPAEITAQQQCLDTLRCKIIAEPNYGTQLQNFAVTGLAAEGQLAITYSAVPISLSGNETVILHKPHYRIHQLQYGALHPKTMLSPRLAPALVGIDKQTIAPYSDFLLHDMGEGLADNRPEGLATGQEWRTAPLWGMGLTQQDKGKPFYLHDGRARLLQEAILWHGGEALAARNNYQRLSKTARDRLLEFLESL